MLQQKSYFDSNYRRDMSFLKSYSSTDMNTHLDLVKEMFSKLKRESLPKFPKILDPGCGRSPFLVIFYDFLFNYHFSWVIDLEERNSYCIKSLYGVELDYNYYRISVEAFNKMQEHYGIKKILKPQIYNEDFIKKDFEKMKFDVFLGNGPFQSNEDRQAKKNKQKSYKQPLWPLFVQKGLSLLSENGLMLYITPMSILAGTYDIRKGRVKLIEYLTSDFNLKYINTNSEGIKKKYFPQIGSTFCYFLVKNEQYQNNTIIENSYGSQTINMSNVKSVPLDPNPIKISINNKTINSNLPKFQFKSVVFKPFGKDCPSPTETNTIKGYCNGGQMGQIKYSYWQKPDKYYGMRKVLIGKTDRSYLPFVDDEGLNIGQNQLWYLPLENDELYESAIRVFNHKLFRFLILANKHGAGPETHLIYSLPKINLKENFSDDEIYDIFQITQDEKNYIESFFA